MPDKYIELRVYIKPERMDDIEEVAEAVKDGIYDYDDEFTPVKDVTWEIKEDVN